MINRKKLFIFLTLAGLGGILLYWQQRPESRPSSKAVKVNSKPSPPSKETGVNVQQKTFHGKKVVGLTPGKEEEELSELQVANEVSSHWQQGTKEALAAQAGFALNDIEIKPIDSFIWIHEGVALNVESTIVSIRDENGRETIFRALADAQNGKILKSWDQPINDPVNPREKTGIKIDPRYYQE